MDHYMDFRLRPDPEFSVSLIMNALFAKLHRALVGLDSQEIGVSFPMAQQDPPNLGSCLRLHGNADNLKRLMSHDWLSGMCDHIVIGSIEMVPEHAKHCRVKRVQPKSSVERLRRRHMKRHNITYDEVSRRLPISVEERVSLPFIRIKSQSSGHRFCLFIEQSIQENAIKGKFNSYGLSRTATVPFFNPFFRKIEK
jgi:CRISPR-associated endonuclease Csy4